MDYTEEVKDLSGDVKVITNEPAFVGPYSIVYHGYLKSSGQLVAIKRMNGIRGASARTIRRKVQREGWTWSLLLHRNILPFYGYIEDDERFQPYGAFVSPWYRRGDLGQYLQENPSAHLADRLKIGVADGVAYLHGYSPVVIHGDLKPGNILVDDDGSAKICDFGLARVIMEEGKNGLTTTTAHTGTSRYLAYELVMAEAGIPTTSSDIYAMGCIGLEVIFREIPYSHRINGNNLLWHIRSDMLEGRFPASRPADSLVHSDPIWKLVLRCWAHDAVSRLQAHELSAHLQEILTPVGAVPHLRLAPLPLTVTRLQAGIQTHTPEGNTGPAAIRMEIDADSSSGQSGPNNPRNQDTYGFDVGFSAALNYTSSNPSHNEMRGANRHPPSRPLPHYPLLISNVNLHRETLDLSSADADSDRISPDSDDRSIAPSPTFSDEEYNSSSLLPPATNALTSLNAQDRLKRVIRPSSLLTNKALLRLLHLIIESPFIRAHELEPTISSNNGQVLLGQIQAIPDCPRRAFEPSSDSIFTLFIASKFRCLICGTSKQSMVRGIGCVRSHLNHRPFPCTGEVVGCKSCGKGQIVRRFFTASLLHDHCSKQERAINCTHCGRTVMSNIKQNWQSKHKHTPFPYEDYPNYQKL